MWDSCRGSPWQESMFLAIFSLSSHLALATFISGNFHAVFWPWRFVKC